MNALIDVDQLRTFIAIVETGSFTKAADVVHKTQSAVSMQMKRLEERLDRAIFARGALLAARFVVERGPGRVTMRDVLQASLHTA